MEIAIRNRQRLIRASRRKIEKAIRTSLKYLAPECTGEKPAGPRAACMRPLPLEVSVILVNDERMRELNRGYRGIDKTTDVLSFPQISYSAGRTALNNPLYKAATSQRPTQLGDIVINLHKAKRQAEDHNVTFYHELSWLLIHGLLHLLGYDHEKNRYQARKMREKESELMKIVCR